MKVFIIDNYTYGNPGYKLVDIIDEAVMTECGIELVDKIKKADVLVVHRITCEIIHSKKPAIICERYDGISIGTSNTYFEYDKIRAVFKDYLPRDISLLTSTTVKKRYHFKLLEDIYKTGSPDDKSYPESILDNLEKIRMVPWGLEQYSHVFLDKYMSHMKRPFEKKIDFFCVSHDHYEPITSHRVHMRKIISDLSNDKKYISFVGSDVHIKDFHTKMSESKIVICPWGLGERIQSDQKGILLDCVVIKPDTDFVRTYPDLYDGDKYYVRCKHDLSDLAEVCEDVLKNYDEYFKRTLAAQELFKSVTAYDLIHNFWTNVAETKLK